MATLDHSALAFAPLHRRAFLTGAGALIVAASLPAGGRMARATDDFMPNAFIRIAPDSKITLVMRDVEMGQGIWTGASMLLAEELEVGLDQVTPVFAPPDIKRYINPLLGDQATGGSTSMRGDWDEFRKLAATTRTVLVQAAAQQWDVDPASCSVVRGTITHTASGRSTTYGPLLALAATLPMPTDVKLKPKETWTLIGKTQKRLDTATKVNGATIYGIDAKAPGMKVASVAMCPVLGGKLVSVDDAKAKTIKGVVAVLKIADGVAVVADHFWAAQQGLEALDISWDFGPNASQSQADIVKAHQDASAGAGVVAKAEGDAPKAIVGASKQLQAVYQLPFLAHAPMEPINCMVHVRADGVDVWCGTQVPVRAQMEAATAAGVAQDKVTVHSHMIGGGFGRRLEAEYVGVATSFAKQVGYPLKMIWSRETDIQRDRFRPYYHDQIAAGLDANGKIVGWTHKITSSSVAARWAPGFMRKNGIDPDAVEGAEETPYDFPALQVSWVRHEPPGIVTAWWRGVGPAHNVFVVESFIDELAHAANIDPVAFRKPLLAKNPRALKVLELAAEKSGWGSALPQGTGRGIMLQSAFGSYLSVVCEAQVAASGDIRLRRLVAALDCGQPVNPDSVRAQIEGGLVFGMTSALYSEVTFDRGRVQQSNFNNYRMLRMNETPAIEVHLVDSHETPGGLGETGTAAAFPALGNAIFAASGKRLRRLPFARAMMG